MKMLSNDDTMDRFIAEQKARLAQERQTLEKNPTSAVSEYLLENELVKNQPINVIDPKQTDAIKIVSKENVLNTKPPTPQLFKLGEAYKKQKEKLKEELRLEYRQALSEKQIRTTGVRGKLTNSHGNNYITNNNNDFGLSLPIRDHLSAKERLRLERNREYNQYKANKENEEKLKYPHRLKTIATSVTSYEVPHINESTQTAPPKSNPRITESYQELLERKRAEEKAYRSADYPEDLSVRRSKHNDENDESVHHLKRVGFSKKRSIPRYVDYYYDDVLDDDDVDETEEELIQRLRARRQRRRRARLELDSDDDDDVAFRRVRHKEEAVREERRKLNSADERARTMAAKENDLRSKSAPPEQEFTGLPIGHVPSANTVQRKKEEYRLDLTKQIEEDRQRKMREKRLDKEAIVPKIDKIEVSVPEQQTGKKKKTQSPQESDDDPKSKRKGKKKSRKFESSDSESEYDGRAFRSRPRLPPYYVPSVMNGYYPQPPPPMSYPSLVDDAYYYYGSQNPLNPAVPPPGTVNFSQRHFQPGVSPLIAAAELKVAGEQANSPEISTTAPAIRGRLSKQEPLKSSLVSDENRDAQKKKEMMQSYQDELKQQMMIKEKKKQQDKKEQEMYDMKKEEEAANYNPWGRGGGGAPMKDLHGNLVSDLRQMHLQNEDLVRDPTKVVELAKQRQKMIANTEEIFQTPRKQDTELFENTPRYGRSNPFEVKDSYEQRTQKDSYKDDLRKQIEEKRRLDAERKEQLRILEEKEEKRMIEDARKMQEEYESEQRKQREKIEEQRRKNEEIQRALAEKRHEEEEKRKEEQRKREEEDRREKERELDEKLKRQHSTVQSTNQELGRMTNRSVISTHDTLIKKAPSVPQRQEVAVQARAPSAPRSYAVTPTPVSRPEKSRESKRISRELSALRKQLLNEQQRIESQLRASDPYDVSYHPSIMKNETLVDLSRTRQRPVHVRRPPSVDRPNSKALQDFNEFKNKKDDTTSLRMFRIQHPDTPADTAALEKQQEDLIKAQRMKIESLKSGLQTAQPRTTQINPADIEMSLMPPSQSFTSLLEAESEYIPIPGSVDSLPPSRDNKPSARQRRRNKRSEVEEGGLTYRATPDNYSMQSLNSLATLDIDRMASKNQSRLEKLKVLQGDEISLTDPDDILDRFVNQQKTSSEPQTPDPFAVQPRKLRQGTSISAPQQDRPPSVNTLDTEVWLRPGTGPAAAT